MLECIIYTIIQDIITALRRIVSRDSRYLRKLKGCHWRRPRIKFPPRKFDSDLVKESLAKRNAQPLIHPIYVCRRTKIYSGRGSCGARVLSRVCLRSVCLDFRVAVCCCACLRERALCVGVRVYVWHTTHETDDRAPLTPEPHGVGLGAREWLWRAEG